MRRRGSSMTSAVFAGILRLFGFTRKQPADSAVAPIIAPNARSHWRLQWLSNNFGRSIRWKFFSVDPAWEPKEGVDPFSSARFSPLCRYAAIARRHVNWKENNPESVVRLLDDYWQQRFAQAIFSPYPFIKVEDDLFTYDLTGTLIRTPLRGKKKSRRCRSRSGSPARRKAAAKSTRPSEVLSSLEGKRVPLSERRWFALRRPSSKRRT